MWAPIGVGTRKVNQSQWDKHHSMRHEEANCHILIAYYQQQMDIDAKPAPITTADAPFNDPTDNVDLVIRTADNVDFFVLSALLSLQSPSSFFRHALQGSRHTEERDGLPVLEVTEDSGTFRTILLFCYPDVAPELRSVQQFQTVGAALDKYCMDRAMGRFVQAVLASSLISEQPLRVYALAVANGWKKIGEAAARNTLAMPLSQAISDVDELNIITARHLYRLLDYHARCGKAAEIQTETSPNPWLTRRGSGLMFLLRGSGGCDYMSIHSHPWLSDTYFRLVNAKVLLEPRSQVALDEHIIDESMIASNDQCRSEEWTKIAASQIRLLGKIVAEEIDRRISEILGGKNDTTQHQNQRYRGVSVALELQGRYVQRALLLKTLFSILEVDIFEIPINPSKDCQLGTPIRGLLLEGINGLFLQMTTTLTTSLSVVGALPLTLASPRKQSRDPLPDGRFGEAGVERKRPHEALEKDARQLKSILECRLRVFHERGHQDDLDVIIWHYRIGERYCEQLSTLVGRTGLAAKEVEVL
ncbi:hypothetical protein ARMSODRAFT_969014 [Armillaria solidipes]|uniref:BTB domain-containing protein n=1 Tax=Armillaria solidipes TaxID=1076256 RepID=A0A2H3C4M7_9AGAR|nr:hypothetical protein ARMSODRAFT_969014 [Armillaria solidipes]